MISLFTAIGGTFKPIGGYNPSINGATSDAPTLFETFASNIFGFLTTIAGIYFLIMFVLGGLQWISAGGDHSKVEKAQSQLTNAAIGLIVVVAAWSIAFVIGKVLGLDVLNPATVINKITPKP